MAVVQLHNATEGRADFAARRAPGKTSMESVRALKRRLSKVVHARMVEDRKRREVRAREGIRGRLCNPA